MTTPWDRMTDDDAAYKNWLLKDATVEEFNGQTLLQRKELRALFEQQQQQHGKLRCCFRIHFCILVFNFCSNILLESVVVQ
jgi:hypothetical protein